MMTIRLTLLALLLFVCGSCSESFYFDKAVRYGNAGDYQLAISYLDKVIKKNPHIYQAYINRGAYNSELGLYREAVADYTKAIKVDSTLIIGYMNRAANRKRLSDFSGALEDYQIAYQYIAGSNGALVGVSKETEISPPFGSGSKNQSPKFSMCDLKIERGIAYYSVDSIAQAFDDLSFCIDNKQHLDLAYYWRAFCYFRIGRTTEACSDLQKSAQLGNRDAVVDYEKYCK